MEIRSIFQKQKVIDINGILDLLINLIKNMSVIIVLAYVFTRTRAYSNILTKKQIDMKQKILLSAVFGLFSIFGTLSGINFNGAIANIRDLGPAIAGLIGGPFVGIGAGIIGGIHRFSMGGLTAVPCSISTVLAGVAGGLIFLKKKGEIPDIKTAAIFMALFEAFHMILNLIVVKPFEVIFEIIKNVSIPMILTNAVGIGIFIFIIHNLVREKETQRQKELIDSELKIAREIQMSIVPKIFPAFPKHKEFDIYAILEPAKEVGGDLYDYFLLDEDHLCFTIGDVSGKGVPASLFMAVTKTLIKAKSDIRMNPDEILCEVNNELCEDNDSGMFVTEFLGILKISTGEITYCNGGHNRPYVLRNGGSIEMLSKTTGIALGAMANMPYVCDKLKLNYGDMLIMYTDGVTEAMNSTYELFEEKRLEDSLSNCRNMTAKETANTVLNSVHEFVQRAPQSDDITIVVLQFQMNTQEA